MIEPQYTKAFSERFGQDFRRDYINKFKSETNAVVRILNEIAAKQSKIVDKTPFDTYKDNLALKVIDERLNAIYDLINSSPEVTDQ